jgi:hypothetical protein
MASKAETRAAIVSLAKELNVTTPDLDAIDKLEPLEALLKELQDKKAAAAGGPPPAPAAPPASPPPSASEPEAPKVLVATTYTVEESKSVTTLRGTIGALEPVWAQDFKGGQKDLDHWVAEGFVKKTEHHK